MTSLLQHLHHERFTAFIELFNAEEGRLGVVFSLLAILELVRESLLELVQVEPFAPIYVRLQS